ncbi:MAG: N-acetyltransferase [Acholeplasmataceae bacterium]|nr:MAG: N-acetyltransferase [Acholeplasmataceae bacterium]
MTHAYRRMPEVHLDDIMLRTLRKEDVNDMYDYGSDPEVTRFLNWGPFTDIKEAKWAIKHVFFKRLRRQLPIGYAIIDVKTSKMIGTIDFHSKMEGRNGAEIGFALHRAYWHQGIMTKAVKAMIPLGFDHLGYDVIIVKHLKANAASQRVIEKNGFLYLGSEPFSLQKKHHRIDDEMMIYHMTKEMYHGHPSRERNL